MKQNLKLYCLTCKKRKWHILKLNFWIKIPRLISNSLCYKIHLTDYYCSTCNRQF